MTGPVEKMASAIREILENDTDDLLCASFNVAGEETPWIQIIPGTLNLWWPHEDEPTGPVKAAGADRLSGLELTDWNPAVFATFDFDESDPDRQAEAVDQLFQNLYHCQEGYAVDVEIYPITDEEIPERIPIAREEGYHTDKIGHYADGRCFMGFVVATLPSPLPDDWQSHKRWYAVLHTFDADGKHEKTDCWFAGTTADGESDVTARAQERLREMLDALPQKRFEDIEIGLFSTECDGHQFGLIDGSFEDEETGEVYVRAELVPNDLVFYDPWDGLYDT